ncbi:hypothetical protein [Oryzifoliimicrobium ureilyticus]|uniref:hypothetical protein n=1 Tax=Oryzifoliimicrobium ureilyticus TaxID=3113724 RepID=UPI00307642F7
MLYSCLIVALIFLTFTVSRFFFVKTRLIEKKIDEVISRKLSASPVSAELNRLKEENGVMRNLLLDMLENEASLSNTTRMSETEKTRALSSRVQRRREICGEALLALQHSEARSMPQLFKTHSAKR